MTDALFSVAGQIVLVSGGSRGIGFAIARGFAERGARVIGTAIFLASPTSAFMTGQTLYVDGRFTAGWAWPIPE